MTQDWLLKTCKNCKRAWIQNVHYPTITSKQYGQRVQCGVALHEDMQNLTPCATKDLIENNVENANWHNSFPKDEYLNWHKMMPVESFEIPNGCPYYLEHIMTRKNE